jgi:hypothetical protein
MWEGVRYCQTEEAGLKGVTKAMGDTFFKALEKEMFAEVDEALGDIPNAAQR